MIIVSHEPARRSGPSAAAVARVDCTVDTRALAANDNVIDPLFPLNPKGVSRPCWALDEPGGGPAARLLPRADLQRFAESSATTAMSVSALLLCATAYYLLLYRAALAPTCCLCPDAQMPICCGPLHGHKNGHAAPYNELISPDWCPNFVAGVISTEDLRPIPPL